MKYQLVPVRCWKSLDKLLLQLFTFFVFLCDTEIVCLCALKVTNLFTIFNVYLYSCIDRN